MSGLRLLIVSCVLLLAAGANGFAQTGPPGPLGPPEFTKTWRNITHPDQVARVGDTLEFTLTHENPCEDSCTTEVRVSLWDTIEPGLELLGSGPSGCTVTAPSFECELVFVCQGILGPAQEVKFLVRVLQTGQLCNQAYAENACSIGPTGPVYLSDDPDLPGTFDPTCLDAIPGTPAVSAWGLALLGAALLTGLGILTAKRRSSVAEP
jgi:uncharacterized repeat protein (TIGR01451 family)